MENYKLISLKDIDFQDESFRFSLSLHNETLETSISRWGMMQPVVLLPKKQENYQILSGFRRMHICRKLGFSSTVCKILNLKEFPKKDLWLYLINDNLFRNISEIEKGEIIFKVLTLMSILISTSCENDKNWVMEEIFPLLKLAKSRKLLEEYLCARSIIYNLKLISYEKLYPLRFIYFLSKFSPEDQKLISQLLSIIPRGHNKVFSLILNLYDITIRDGVTLSFLLENHQAQSILNNPDLSSSEKGERLKSLVKNWRFPNLCHAEERFKEKKKKLKLAKNVSLELPKYMEGRNLTFHINANCSSDLLKGSENLRKISEKFSLESYFFDSETK